MGGTMAGGGDSSTMAIMHLVHELMVNHDKLRRTVTNLLNDVRTVTETSADSATVALVQRPAADVTDQVNRGMAAMHEAMTQNRGMGGMRGAPPVPTSPSAPPRSFTCRRCQAHRSWQPHAIPAESREDCHDGARPHATSMLVHDFPVRSSYGFTRRAYERSSPQSHLNRSREPSAGSRMRNVAGYVSAT